MKKLSPILAMLCLLTPAPAAIIGLNFSTTTPTAGSNFTVDVLLSGVFDSPVTSEELLAFGFDMFTNNNAVVSIVSATVGSLFFEVPTSANLSGVTVDPSITPISVIEPVFLATITFQAVAAGTTTVGVRTDLTTPNPDHGLFYADAVNTLTLGIDASQSITVLGGAEVPEPSTILLVGGALLCAGFVRRRSA